MKKLACALAVSLLVLLSVTGGSSQAAPMPPVTMVAAFTPPALPEGVVIDRQGNIYVSMVPTGEIRRITPSGEQSTVATLRAGASGFLVALALDRAGDLYAALASHNAPDTDTHGVWRIRPNGTKELVAAIPEETGVPNQLAFDRAGNLFVTDSLLGNIWRVTPQGSVTKWLDHPLLKPNTGACPNSGLRLPIPVGVNGIAFDRHGNLWAVHGDLGHVLRIPINRDTGAAEAPEIVHSAFTLLGCATKGGDGIAFDVAGNLYIGLNVQNRLVRLSPEGVVHTLATAAEGLDFPTNVAFGTRPGDETNLYVANLAFLTFASGGNARPSLVKLNVGVRGLPLP